jgi:hypothetical protein
VIRPGLLLLLLGVSAARAADPLPFAWPTPGLIEETEVPGIVQSRGIPMKLRAVRVKPGPDEMLRTYLKAFQLAGFYLPPPKDQVELFRDLSLTALDYRRWISYTVIFQANRDGTTTLIMGEANIARRQPPEADDSTPLFPGATSVLRANAEGSDSVTFRAKAAPVEIFGFYRDLLGREHFQVQESNEQDLALSDGRREMRIHIEPIAGGLSQVLVVFRGR